jgi:hypothetical protein
VHLDTGAMSSLQCAAVPPWATRSASHPEPLEPFSLRQIITRRKTGDNWNEKMTKATITIAILLMCGTMLANAQVSSGHKQGQGSGTEQSNKSGNRGTPATGNTSK